MSLPVLKGRAAWVFEEANFDVDRILGFEAMREHNPAKLALAAMRPFDPAFIQSVRPGDMLIGGRNFGYGHPHGPPMAAMRKLGITAVIAESFAPLYLIGEYAAGFPQITCPGVCAGVSRWDELEVDWDGHRLTNLTAGLDIPFLPPSAQEQRLVEAGGLFNLLKRAHEVSFLESE